MNDQIGLSTEIKEKIPFLKTNEKIVPKYRILWISQTIHSKEEKAITELTNVRKTKQFFFQTNN